MEQVNRESTDNNSGDICANAGLNYRISEANEAQQYCMQGILTLWVRKEDCISPQDLDLVWAEFPLLTYVNIHQ